MDEDEELAALYQLELEQRQLAEDQAYEAWLKSLEYEHAEDE